MERGLSDVIWHWLQMINFRDFKAKDQDDWKVKCIFWTYLQKELLQRSQTGVILQTNP